MKREIMRIVASVLWDTGAIKISDAAPFQLTSGNMSPIYIDCRLVISRPVARDFVTCSAHWMYVTEELHADYVAGGETAGIPYAAWLAERLDKPLIYIRKKPKSHGAKSQIEGDLEPGGEVLLYEDLITDGGSKLNFIEGIRRAGGAVSHCLVLFDRQQGGEETLAAHGVSLHAMTDLDTVLTLGSESGRIGTDELDSLREYVRDPGHWHARRGYTFHDT